MRKREWALLAFVYLVLAEVLSWNPVPDLSLCLIQPEHSEQTANHDDKKYCPSFSAGIVAAFDATDGFLERHDKSVVGGFTIVLAISTIGLWLATISLYQAGERQLEHIKADSEAADFHRTAQFEQIADQIRALRQSAEAAENQANETRELVWNTDLNAQRQLRAYVIADVISVEFQAEGKDGFWPIVKIILKNTGQTPAHDVRVVAKVELVKHPIELPFDFSFKSEPYPTVGVLGPGEIVHRPATTEIPFDGNEMMVAESHESGFRIYCWGMATYRDVFDTTQYTNFCGSIRYSATGQMDSHVSEHHNNAS